MQVFIDGQRGEDAAFLRHEADACMGGAMQRHAHHVLAVEGDRPCALADNPHDGAQRCRLADTVAAEQGDRLALVNVEIDAVQGVAFAIPGIEVPDGEAARYSCSVPI